MKHFKHWNSLSLCALLIAAFHSAARAELKLPSVFGNHMVLQRQQSVPIWGWADAGETVHVVLGDDTKTATANDDGKWQVRFGEHSAGGPHKVVVEAGNDRKEFNDVYFGEVWVASGQSNMQWSVRQSANAEEEISAGDHPMIRMFSVPRVPSAEPQQDSDGKWEIASPKTVANFSAVGYYFARELQLELEVPVGILHTSWGGTRAEVWTSREALEANEILKPIVDRVEQEGAHHNRAAHLYNKMLHPLIPYAIKGAIWYQGESNVGRAEQYATLFPTMIRDWRSKWGQGDFPFNFVQLAPYRYGNTDPELLAELWDAQLVAHRSLPNVGMAVTTDITTLNNIHPPNKQDVGKRLALWALANSYDKDVAFSGPIYKSHEVDGNTIVLHFDHVGEGLKVRGEDALNDFTIAGRDRKFVQAKAQIVGDTIVASSDDVPEPVAVRFGWYDTAQPNLTNEVGLPASPFRTDHWQLKTHGNR